AGRADGLRGGAEDRLAPAVVGAAARRRRLPRDRAAGAAVRRGAALRDHGPLPLRRPAMSGSSRSGGAPAPAFHELIHAPVRLRLCLRLRPVDEVELAVLRVTLQLKHATLSKNLNLLADACLVPSRKQFSPVRHDACRLTLFSLTEAAHAAFSAHLAALQ